MFSRLLFATIISSGARNGKAPREASQLAL
jgi:hypothetical protein